MPQEWNPPVQPTMTDAELARELERIERKLANSEDIRRQMSESKAHTEVTVQTLLRRLNDNTDAIDRMDAEIAALRNELVHMRSQAK